MRERVALLGVSVTCYIRWELPPPWHVHQVECSYNGLKIISILSTNLSYKLGDLQQKISRAITCTVYNTHNTVSTRSLSFYMMYWSCLRILFWKGSQSGQYISLGDKCHQAGTFLLERRWQSRDLTPQWSTLTNAPPLLGQSTLPLASYSLFLSST